MQIHQFLIYDQVTLYSANTNAIKENGEALLLAIKEIDLEVNAEETECMFMLINSMYDKTQHQCIQ
jgi:hypothetical protein